MQVANDEYKFIIYQGVLISVKAQLFGNPAFYWVILQ